MSHIKVPSTANPPTSGNPRKDRDGSLDDLDDELKFDLLIPEKLQHFKHFFTTES